MEHFYPAIKLENEKTLILKQMRLMSVDLMAIEKRYEGSLKDKAYFLSDIYDWVIGKDESQQLCLIPLIKEFEVEPEA